MMIALALAAGALVTAGVFLALSRDALRAVIGVSLMGSGANLVVLSAGRLDRTMPAFVAEGAVQLSADAADPLPQALVLTAVVIAFSLTCLALTLVLAIWDRVGITDLRQLKAAEPPPGADGKPMVLGDGR